MKWQLSTCTHVNFEYCAVCSKEAKNNLTGCSGNFPLSTYDPNSNMLVAQVCCCQGWVKHFSACALSTFIKCLTVLQTLDRIEALCLCLYLSTCFKCVNA